MQVGKCYLTFHGYMYTLIVLYTAIIGLHQSLLSIYNFFSFSETFLWSVAKPLCLLPSIHPFINSLCMKYQVKDHWLYLSSEYFN